MFRRISDGKIIYFEKFNDSELNRQNVLHIVNKYTIITFNGNKYDCVILEAACQGFTNESLHKITGVIIDNQLQAWQARKQFGIAAMEFDHIDLIEVAPLKASLKIYGGRLHCPTLQDLPIPPEAIIRESDLPNMRSYCGNDLKDTELLFLQLEPEIELRTRMSEEYGVDLRSKSDAQIAEAVIKKEMDKHYGVIPKRPKVKPETEYFYKAPSNLEFKTPILKDLFRQYTTLPFIVSDAGYVEFNFEITEEDRNKKGALPKQKKKLKFMIGDTKYTSGIGGLHSCEKSVSHTNDRCILRDYDVASYYPRIILNNKLFPKHIGPSFLKIYESIVNRRLKAKKSGDKVTNESLKITINGSFGKLGSKWSCLYSPDLMLQVTVTGQLNLLMLIERFELAGIPVVSANTDGIVVKMEPELETLARSIVEDWEFDTGYEMEGTDYCSLNSRDINNYIAVKEKGSKGKGAYCDQREHYYKLRSNPTNDICTEAVKEFLTNNVPIRDTILGCRDITKFISLRTVNGGAVKDGKLIGKAIRWYYGVNELDAIYYKTSGNKVPKSEGGVPIMELPDKFPNDVDLEWYVNEAKRILKDIGQ
jgi:DNA polymerase elongation subunit (family B)